MAEKSDKFANVNKCRKRSKSVMMLDLYSYYVKRKEDGNPLF